MSTNITAIVQASKSVLDHQGFWALLGVTVGFVFAEGSRFLRDSLRRRKLRRNLRDELQANLYLIAQKKDLVRKVIDGLRREQIRPAVGVPICSMIYDNHMPQIAALLSPKERDNIHIIYEQLKGYDVFLDKFRYEIMESINLKIMAQPYDYYANPFTEINGKYDVTAALIQFFLNNKPKDVLYRHSDGKPPDSFRTTPAVQEKAPE